MGVALPPDGTQHEADVPAEQPQAEADPWLPGPHADQGGPPRPEAAPAEGPQADRGLTARGRRGRARAFPAVGTAALGGGLPARVLRKGLRLDGPLFALIAVEQRPRVLAPGPGRVAPDGGRRPRATAPSACCGRASAGTSRDRGSGPGADPQAGDPGRAPRPRWSVNTESASAVSPPEGRPGVAARLLLLGVEAYRVAALTAPRRLLPLCAQLQPSMRRRRCAVTAPGAGAASPSRRLLRCHPFHPGRLRPRPLGTVRWKNAACSSPSRCPCSS